jgi:hypothetical protein
MPLKELCTLVHFDRHCVKGSRLSILVKLTVAHEFDLFLRFFSHKHRVLSAYINGESNSKKRSAF